MSRSRVVLLVVSTLAVAMVLGGGLAMRASAADNPYRQAVLFSEVMSLVLENYVDPVDPEGLLHGAYEGMLGGLDAHGAYLTPAEVRAWKSRDPRPAAGPGLSVLKSYGLLQVVAVEPGSPAERAGIVPGDQIRRIDEHALRDLSLDQSASLLRGPAGTRVALDLLHSRDGFRRESLSLERVAPSGAGCDFAIDSGVAVLTVRDLSRIDVDAVARDLDDAASGGRDHLLVDLRNVADGSPRTAAPLAALFVSGDAFRLVDHAGKVVETVTAPARETPAWRGKIAVLVNGATAGGAEALARLLQVRSGATVLGEETYGLATEPKLYELEDGSGVLLPSRLWELASGETWNDGGIKPDESVVADGRTYEDRQKAQLSKAIELFQGPPASARQAA